MKLNKNQNKNKLDLTSQTKTTNIILKFKIHLYFPIFYITLTKTDNSLSSHVNIYMDF